MATLVYGKGEYYRTADVCRMAGISRSTLLRWIRSGVVRRSYARDRRGWRLFSRDDVNDIASVASRVLPAVDEDEEA